MFLIDFDLYLQCKYTKNIFTWTLWSTDLRVCVKFSTDTSISWGIYMIRFLIRQYIVSLKLSSPPSWFHIHFFTLLFIWSLFHIMYQLKRRRPELKLIGSLFKFHLRISRELSEGRAVCLVSGTESDNNSPSLFLLDGCIGIFYNNKSDTLSYNLSVH